MVYVQQSEKSHCFKNVLIEQNLLVGHAEELSFTLFPELLLLINLLGKESIHLRILLASFSA